MLKYIDGKYLTQEMRVKPNVFSQPCWRGHNLYLIKAILNYRKNRTTVYVLIDILEEVIISQEQDCFLF